MKKIKLINGRVLLSPVALATYLAAVYAVGLNRASQYFLAVIFARVRPYYDGKRGGSEHFTAGDNAFRGVGAGSIR